MLTWYVKWAILSEVIGMYCETIIQVIPIFCQHSIRAWHIFWGFDFSGFCFRERDKFFNARWTAKLVQLASNNPATIQDLPWLV